MTITSESVREHLQGGFGQGLFEKLKKYRPSLRHSLQDFLLRTIVLDEDFKHRMIEQMADQSWAKGARMAGREFKARFRKMDRVPSGLRAPVWCGTRPFIPSIVAGKASRFMQEFVGERLCIGRDFDSGFKTIAKLSHRGIRCTVAISGEMVETSQGADDYLDKNISFMKEWADRLTGPAIASNHSSGVPVLEISIKPSSLSRWLKPEYWKEGIDDAAVRLADLARLSQNLSKRGRPVLLNLDREQEATYGMIDELLTRVFGPGEFFEFQDFGAVLTANREKGFERAENFISWCEENGKRPKLRLVAGAMINFDRMEALRHGWHDPTQPDKGGTKEVFEKTALLLLSKSGVIRPAFGTHNPYDVFFIQAARDLMGLSPDTAEMQFLHGFGDPYYGFLKEMGVPLRDYAVIGGGIDFNPYFARRFDEKTPDSAEVKGLGALSFDALAVERKKLLAASKERKPEASASRAADPLNRAFQREPVPDETDPGVRGRIESAFDRGRWAKAERFSLLIGGTGDYVPPDPEWKASIDPTYPQDPEAAAGFYPKAGVREVEITVREANRAFPEWAAVPTRGRAEMALRLAEILRREMFGHAALITREGGKPRALAIHEVIEEIEAVEEDAREAVLLEKYEGRRQPLGVVFTIGPGNFPGAIPIQQAIAAILAGNAVIFKPAEQTPITGRRLVEMFREAGLPSGVFQWLPGTGEDVGVPIVKHPDVDAVLFTGSLGVATEIHKLAGEHPSRRIGPKEVIFETGASNSMLVDRGADLNAATEAAVQSKFGHAGQRCSALQRLIEVGGDPEFRERLFERTRDIVTGDPAESRTEMGPLADANAVARYADYLRRAKEDIGEPIFKGSPSLTGDLKSGFFAGPVIFKDAGPSHSVWHREAFSPVLLLAAPRNWKGAIHLANSTGAQLTSAVFSGNPDHIREAARQIHAGNIYIHQAQVGARRRRQPFGFGGDAGNGEKVGGRFYLMRLTRPVSPRSRSERFFGREYADTALPDCGDHPVGNLFENLERGGRDLIRAGWQRRVESLKRVCSDLERDRDGHFHQGLIFLRRFVEAAPSLLKRQKTLDQLPGSLDTIAHDRPKGLELVIQDLSEPSPAWIVAAVARALVMGNPALLVAATPDEKTACQRLKGLFSRNGFPEDAFGIVRQSPGPLIDHPQVRRVVYHGTNTEREAAYSAATARMRDFSGSRDDPEFTDLYLHASACQRTICENTWRGGSEGIAATGDLDESD